ncbi:hypothetical protein BYT27DRAFT_7255987 [Phlegmacium glaucopus]|nr:hypothetical protein BYT27DRAFT_7255987 [Phlegmacium glaucopus]
MSTNHKTFSDTSSQLLPLKTTSAKPILSASSPLREGSFFGASIYTSPEHSDNDNSDTDGGYSDSTLEDEYPEKFFGHPLERMPRIKGADHGFHYEQDLNYLLLTSRSSRSSSKSESVISSTSGTSYDAIDYDEIVDYLLNLRPDPFDHRNLIFSDFGKHSVISPSLMIKRLQRSSSELRLLLELNLPESRDDPWNPAPHILRAVERADDVYLCLQRLSEYNQPPLIRVSHYIDFSRQILEGVSFLHERSIAGLNCAEPSSYMVDLSSASLTSGCIGPQQFDRVSYPVKYYLVNYTNASYIWKGPTLSSSLPGSPTRELEELDPCPFKKDVQDSATMIDRLLSDVPQISLKFKPLIKAMTLGGFTAEDSRRLFEALCRALEASIFETAAGPSKRARTTPNPTPISKRAREYPLDRARSSHAGSLFNAVK